jgi:uncharacterized phiE125 gp8 family phage protein
MTYATIQPPAAEALTLADVKAHLRIEDAAEDALLAGLIATARDHLERMTGLALISRTMRLYLDAWPRARVLDIAHGPVQAITDIRVFDASGAESGMDLAGLVLDGAARPARLWLRSTPAPGQALNGIEIDFIAGFGEAGTDVPDTLKRAMLVHIALMYEFRGAVPLDQQPAAVPDGYERLIAPFLIRRL